MTMPPGAITGSTTLEQFGDAIWIASGPTTEVAGFTYPTRMVVIRLPDGTLFVWSPIALTEALRLAVDALGPVAHLVAPNSLHHLFIAAWQRAYPGAALYAAPGLQARRPDVAFDITLSDAAPAAWAADIEQVVVGGNRITSEIVFFHRASRTVIFTDLLQQFDAGWFSGWRGLIARLDLMTTPVPAVPRKFRLAFTDRHLARAALWQILRWRIQRVLMAHGAPIHDDGHAVVAEAFDWLLRGGGGCVARAIRP